MRAEAEVLSSRRAALFTRWLHAFKAPGASKGNASFLGVVLPHEHEQIAAHVEHKLIVLEYGAIPSTVEQKPDGFFGDVEFLTVMRPALDAGGEPVRRRC